MSFNVRPCQHPAESCETMGTSAQLSDSTVSVTIRCKLCGFMFEEERSI